MSKQEAAKSLLWMVPYFRQTEAEACRKFWSVAQYAGVHLRRDDEKAPAGYLGFWEKYNPVIVTQNPAGFTGQWTLQLSENVRFLQTPYKASTGLPVAVRHTLRIAPYSHNSLPMNCANTIVRPLVHVFPGEDGPPGLYLARPSVLARHDMHDMLQAQARYMTWLTLVQQATMEP